MVEAILAGLLLLAVAVASVAWGVHQRKAITEAWGEVGRAHNLYFTPPAPFSEPRLSGSIDGVDVRIVGERRRAGDSHETWTVLSVSHPQRARIDIRSEGALSSITKAVFTGKDVEIGSPGDDAALRLSGSPHELVALLDADTRSAARRWLHKGGVISEGDVTYEVRGTITSAYQLQGLLAEALQIAGALQSPADIHATLAQRCLDPEEETGVRRRALALIGRSSAITHARLELLRNPRSPDVLVREALRGSTVGLDAELVTELLARPNCPGSALTVAANMGVPIAPGRVVEFLRRAEDDIRDAAVYIQRHPDRCFEEPLLAALRRSKGPAVLAVIEALALCGTLGAVESLLAVSNDSHRVPAAQAAARRAIATLQSDADPAARGGLSMIGSSEGGLSESPPQAGALSQTKRQPS